MQKVAQSEVRNLKFHVKIKDRDLLGGAINDIVAKRTSGKIDPQGRGFRPPDAQDNFVTIYSSTIILADQSAAPGGNYIYTMDEVVFSTDIKVEEKDKKFTEQESDVTLTGGWVMQNGEYVLVIFTKKNGGKMSDLQKMQGRTFYNAVLTRYVTDTLGKNVFELRNFDVRMTENDYPDPKYAFDVERQRAIDFLRGGAKPTKKNYDQPTENTGTGTWSGKPDFVKKNYYLYDKADANITFGYKDPAAPPKPFNKATDAGINFRFKFPDFVTDETIVDQSAAVTYNKPSDNSNPETVEVEFMNVPRNMPGEIFSNVFDYMKDGLDAKEMRAGTNLTYGNTIFHKDPKHGEDTLFEKNSKKIKELLSEIKSLMQDNKEYMVDFDTQVPLHRKSKGINKNLLKYLGELEAYVKTLRSNLPMSLAELDRIIAEKGEYAVNPKNVNLIKILKTQP